MWNLLANRPTVLTDQLQIKVRENFLCRQKRACIKTLFSWSKLKCPAGLYTISLYKWNVYQYREPTLPFSMWVAATKGVFLVGLLRSQFDIVHIRGSLMSRLEHFYNGVCIERCKTEYNIAGWFSSWTKPETCFDLLVNWECCLCTRHIHSQANCAFEGRNHKKKASNHIEVSCLRDKHIYCRLCL